MARPADIMNPDEAALRAALNVLRDSVESGRMPSGLPLEPPGRDMHERAIERLEGLLQRVQAGRVLRPRGPQP